MKPVYYEFCGIPIEIHAPRPLPDPAEQFLTDETSPQIHITITSCRELPRPEGSFLGRSGEKQIWRKRSKIIRVSLDRFCPQPHMAAGYDLENWNWINAWIRQEYWCWAAGSRYLWTGLALPQILLHAGVLLFHASYIICEGQGILFTAPSQTGKSTQAELWRRCRGAEIINGDKAAVRLDSIPTAYSVPFSGTSGICQNSSCPLKAMVVLSQAPQNTIRPMAPAEAVAALCPNMFGEQIVEEEWNQALNLLLKLTTEVPIYALACTPDERAVKALEQVL